MQRLERFENIHFIGIGGAGMSAIALILLDRGFGISGSDLADNAITRKLAAKGARINLGHDPTHVQGADMVVISTAIGPDNPERREAEALAKPIWHRAEALAAIMRSGRAIAVSGTHGKTTTTSMLGLMLAGTGMDPTVLVGGELNDFGGNARPGGGEWIVAEADESDASFLSMDPDRIIITNIEADHLDFYDGPEAVIETFGRFIDRLRPGGGVIACLDDPAVRALIAGRSLEAVTYGIDSGDADLRATEIEPIDRGRGSRSTIFRGGHRLGELRLRVPGRHNVLNALGALAAAMEIGAEFEPLCRVLAEYRGVKRRFELKGAEGGVTVIDDYAHHPTEVTVSLEAARGCLTDGEGEPQAGRLIGVLQPHRYTRTQAMAPAFATAMMNTDVAVITEIYGAGEAPIDGVSGRLIYDQVVAQGHPNVHFFTTLEESRIFLASHLALGDLVLTMGAGDVWLIGEGLLEDLRSRQPAGA